MQQDGNGQISSSPSLCRNGCGFYGSQSYQGMCSICFRDKQLRQNKEVIDNPQTICNPMESAQPTVMTTATAIVDQNNINEKTENAVPETPSVSIESQAPVENKTPSSNNVSTSVSKDKPNSNKRKHCGAPNCKKRLCGAEVLLKCKCEKTFCGLHRLPEQHDCDFDYKGQGKDKLKQENPACVGEKIQQL